MKIFTIAGHHNRDSGATATYTSTGDIRESEFTIELKYLVKSYLLHNNIITDNDNHTLSKVIEEVNKMIDPQDLLIDLHFNSFHSNKATGTEVILRNEHSKLEHQIADELCERLSEIMNIPNRGVRTERDSQHSRIGILHGKGLRLLLEVCFLSNINDVTAYVKNKHLVAYAIAETLDKYV